MRGAGILVQPVEIKAVLGHAGHGLPSAHAQQQVAAGLDLGSNPPGISTGVPSNSVHGFQCSLRMPKATAGRFSPTTSAPNRSSTGRSISASIW